MKARNAVHRMKSVVKGRHWNDGSHYNKREVANWMRIANKYFNIQNTNHGN
jgi:hypothetical protein